MNDYEADRACQEKMQAACGTVAQEPPTPKDAWPFTNFRERMQNRLRRARREADKGAAIDELLYLLDKHPEVARILELIEAIGQ